MLELVIEKRNACVNLPSLFPHQCQRQGRHPQDKLFESSMSNLPGLLGYCLSNRPVCICGVSTREGKEAGDAATHQNPSVIKNSCAHRIQRGIWFTRQKIYCHLVVIILSRQLLKKFWKRKVWTLIISCSQSVSWNLAWDGNEQL